MEDIATLKEELRAVKKQLSLIASKLETVGLSEGMEITFSKLQVALLQTERELKAEIIKAEIAANNLYSAVTPSGIYRCMKSVYVNYVCI